MKTKVENMTSSNGNTVPNQFIIWDENGNKFFQSYSTIIAVRRRDGQIELDEESWDYSVTTSKYRNYFLGEKKAVTEKKIANGTYKLTNLNP